MCGLMLLSGVVFLCYSSQGWLLSFIIFFLFQKAKSVGVPVSSRPNFFFLSVEHKKKAALEGWCNGMEGTPVPFPVQSGGPIKY